jgi:Flp pilus assembly protein TadG
MTSIWKICSGRKSADSTLHREKRRKAGQALVFFLGVLVILVFVVLWNFDLHKILSVKATTQNAGDAAALAAARWQAISLNLMGDLNIMHAVALTSGDSDTASSITNIQARLCFTGPMTAFMASQQAAQNNGIYPNASFDELLKNHADAVRNDYTSRTRPDGTMLFPEPYAGCWREYADMLDLIAAEGVAAGPDNAVFYTDVAGNYILLRKDFYDAIAGKIWCWFFLNAPDLLDNYHNFFPCWWPALPDPAHRDYINSEIYSLCMERRTTRLSDFITADTATGFALNRGLGNSVSNDAMTVDATWYCYDGSWGPWDAIKPAGDFPFPVTGELRPQYDYVGADAVVRIDADFDRLTPGSGGITTSDHSTWSAAAKPFGYLNEADKPTDLNIVLPAFKDIRLIPVDTASGPAGGSYDLEWRKHIEIHLPLYLKGGPGAIQGDADMLACWYCQQLLVWENEEFRQEGVEWLKENNYLCTLPSGPGGGHRGGGSRRGH